MKKTLLQLFAFIICISANAQSYVDSFIINKAKTSAGSSPIALTAADFDLHFIAYDSAYRYQLYTLKNNATTPVRVSNIDTSLTIDIGAWTANYDALHTINGTTFLTITDKNNGSELWSYNSTGYSLVKDIFQGVSSAMPKDFLVHDNILYFTANTPEHGREMWRHVPATNVTERITDISPTSLGSSPRDAAVFNSKIYFCANDSTHGAELFEYDPATKQTKLIADINPGKAFSSPGHLVVMAGKLYFMATTLSHGAQLWVYDGIATPQVLTESNSDMTGVMGNVKPVIFNNKLYFNTINGSKSSLVYYDPTTNEVKITDVKDASITNLTVYNDAIYYSGNNSNFAREIFKYDGNTPPVAITTLSGQNTSRTFRYFTATPHELFFVCNSYKGGTELFRLSQNKLNVENVAFNAEVTVYPNPTTDIARLQMNLQESQSLTVSVTDMNGRTVYTTGNVLYSAATHTVNIPMRNLPAGTYTYRISNPQGSLMNSGKLQKL